MGSRIHLCRDLNLPKPPRKKMFVHLHRARVLVASLLMICTGLGRCEEENGLDHSVILEIGPAAERDLKNNVANYGGSFAVEVTPIENWLELELGLARLATAGRREQSIDLLFKKPFRLASNAELMVGLGPQFARMTGNQERASSRSVEFALDFMYWPSKNVGWFFEPGYSVGVGKNAGEKSFGAAAGLLVGW